jgi:hypothetical protein
MSDKQKRKRLDDSKENRLNMTTGFNLLKKCVPGTYKLSRPEILISAVNYTRELEECIEKRIKYTLPLPMECTQLFSGPRDSTLDCYPIPSTCMEQESTDSTLDSYIVPSTTMDDHLGGPSTPMVTGPSTPIAEYSDITEPSTPMVTFFVCLSYL